VIAPYGPELLDHGGKISRIPPVNRIDKDQREAIVKKYGDMFAFPRG